jgi:hypothetical protein
VSQGKFLRNENSIRLTLTRNKKQKLLCFDLIQASFILKLKQVAQNVFPHLPLHLCVHKVAVIDRMPQRHASDTTSCAWNWSAPSHFLELALVPGDLAIQLGMTTIGSLSPPKQAFRRLPPIVYHHHT